MRCLILHISFRFTKDSVLSAIFIVILLVVLVVGIQYTVYNCQKLARTVRNDDKTRNKSTTLHIHQNAVKSLKQQALTYSRTTHQQLGNEPRVYAATGTKCIDASEGTAKCLVALCGHAAETTT